MPAMFIRTSVLALMLIGTPKPPQKSKLWTPSADPDAKVINRIIGAAIGENRAYQRLGYLSDYIGPRLSGSNALQRAIDWAEAELRKDKIRVKKEKVMVPKWVRGKESAALLNPIARNMRILGLGMSVGTAPEGVTGEVVVVDSFEALEALGARVKGKIVLYNAPMGQGQPFSEYGKNVRYRGQGASKAAKLGALAVLVRSLTTRSLYTPHTGSLRYEKGVPKIPAAALTVEDASLIQRFYDRGEKVQVRLSMAAKHEGEVPSANVVAEIKGRSLPQEIVLVGGHIDSWDVGTGATDDGAGVVVSMEVLSLIRRLGLRPKRTIRAVLFTNEENGLKGAFAYFEAHKSEKHVAAIESDAGSTKPYGFSVYGEKDAEKQLGALLSPLQRIEAGELFTGFSGADLIPLMRAGVLGFGLRSAPEHYFDLHHTHADTFEKIEPFDIALQTAAMTILVWRLANAKALPKGKKPSAN